MGSGEGYVTRLHVWEHPSLHGLPGEGPAVEVIFEPHEFDGWKIDGGFLQIGNWTDPNHYGRSWSTHTQINANLVAKVVEEIIELRPPADSDPREEGSVGRERFDFADTVDYYNDQAKKAGAVYDDQEVRVVRPGSPPVDLGPAPDTYTPQRAAKESSLYPGEDETTKSWEVTPTGEYKRPDLSDDPKVQTGEQIKQRMRDTQLLPPVTEPAVTEVFPRYEEKKSPFFDQVMDNQNPG